MKTKIYREGDAGGDAICHSCKVIRSTTFMRKDVPLSDGMAVVHDVLVGVCDECGEVLSTPPQSTPRIARVVKSVREPVEARVPAHIKDMMMAVTARLGQTEKFEGAIFRYYLKRWSEHHVPVTRIAKFRRHALFSGEASRRMSFKVPDASATIETISVVAGIKTKADIVKVVTFAAYEDVVEKPDSQAGRRLAEIAAAVG